MQTQTKYGKYKKLVEQQRKIYNEMVKDIKVVVNKWLNDHKVVYEYVEVSLNTKDIQIRVIFKEHSAWKEVETLIYATADANYTIYSDKLKYLKEHEQELSVSIRSVLKGKYE